MEKPTPATPAAPHTEHHEARGRSVVSEVATLIAPVTDRHVAPRRGTGGGAARGAAPRLCLIKSPATEKEVRGREAGAPGVHKSLIAQRGRVAPPTHRARARPG